MNRDIYNQLCFLFQEIKKVEENQQLILDKLNGVKHYMPGDCEICIDNRASYRVIHIEHPDRVLEVCASCMFDMTSSLRRESKWRREPINH